MIPLDILSNSIPFIRYLNAKSRRHVSRLIETKKTSKAESEYKKNNKNVYIIFLMLYLAATGLWVYDGTADSSLNIHHGPHRPSGSDMTIFGAIHRRRTQVLPRSRSGQGFGKIHSVLLEIRIKIGTGRVGVVGLVFWYHTARKCRIFSLKKWLFRLKITYECGTFFGAVDSILFGYSSLNTLLSYMFLYPCSFLGNSSFNP